MIVAPDLHQDEWPRMTYLTVTSALVPILKGPTMTLRTIGIDLAIRGDHVAQIYDDGRPVGRAIRFRHDTPSLITFVQRARAGMTADDHTQAVMEPTGMSWFPVAHHLADVGIAVARVKGKRVKALRRYLSEHAKTDLADAQVLAAIPSFGGPRLDPVHIPEARSHALQRLTKQRSRFQDNVADAKRRLLDLIRWASPKLEGALPDLTTRLSLALLQRWFDPAAVLKARPTTLTKYIAAHASGNHPHSGPFVDRLVEGLREAARHAQGLHGRHVDFGELQIEIATEVDIILAKLRAIVTLEQRIADLYAELDPKALLASIPGIGRHLGPTLLGILHDVGRFQSERHMRGFCGLFPRRADSGGSERPGQTITKSGNDRIKRALILAADTARKIDPELAEIYRKMMVVKGHHHKQALCAIANRLANRIYSVLKQGRPYVLRDIDGSPLTVAQAKAIILERYRVPDSVRAGRRANRAEITP
ncbi:IS110 family transposase [Komagataeibacter sp. SM21]|uniref:IS110 family transposase n=1 Tax=Komagataeibacter sp. SM21 TaxID=3242899 RepID=UPI003527F369